MDVTRARFKQGLPYAAYKAQMTCNREQFEAIEQTVALIPAELDFFARLPQQLQILVLTEDWCESAIEYIPPLAQLAAAAGTLQLHILLRDQNLELMDQYLENGINRTIPTFVFFSENFQELGHWRPPPAKIRELLEARGRELFATEPVLAGLSPETPWPELPPAAQERLSEAFQAFRGDIRPLRQRELMRELRELLERSLASTPV